MPNSSQRWSLPLPRKCSATTPDKRRFLPRSPTAFNAQSSWNPSPLGAGGKGCSVEFNEGNLACTGRERNRKRSGFKYGRPDRVSGLPTKSRSFHRPPQSLANEQSRLPHQLFLKVAHHLTNMRIHLHTIFHQTTGVKNGAVVTTAEGFANGV